MSIGFSAPAGHDILEDFSETSVTNFVAFSGLLMLFMLDFHHVVLRALMDSYSVTQVGAVLEPQKMLITILYAARLDHDSCCGWPVHS